MDRMAATRAADIVSVARASVKRSGQSATDERVFDAIVCKHGLSTAAIAWAACGQLRGDLAGEEESEAGAESEFGCGAQEAAYRGKHRREGDEGNGGDAVRPPSSSSPPYVLSLHLRHRDRPSGGIHPRHHQMATPSLSTKLPSYRLLLGP